MATSEIPKFSQDSDQLSNIVDLVSTRQPVGKSLVQNCFFLWSALLLFSLQVSAISAKLNHVFVFMYIFYIKRNITTTHKKRLFRVLWILDYLQSCYHSIGLWTNVCTVYQCTAWVYTVSEMGKNQTSTMIHMKYEQGAWRSNRLCCKIKLTELSTYYIKGGYKKRPSVECHHMACIYHER